MSELKRTAEEWSIIKGIRIYDPDGWRLDDGVRLESNITETEFIWRAAMSSVMTRSGND